MTYNRAKKPHRIAVLLSAERYALLKELMSAELEENTSAFFSNLIMRRRDCLAEHTKSKVGRPRNDEDDSLRNLPEAPPMPVDTLSFTPQELAKLKKK